MSDYVIDVPRKYKAPFIDPSEEVDDRWVTRAPYRFVDVEWFIDTCIKYPKEAVDYGLRKNAPKYVNCFYPRDVAIRDDYEEDDASDS